MLKHLSVFLSLTLASSAFAFTCEPVEYVDGELLYAEDFTQESPLGWRTGKGFEYIPNGAPDGKSGAFKLTGTVERNYCSAHKQLPSLEKLAGKLICVEAMIKTENVVPSWDYYGGANFNFPNSRDGKNTAWPRAEIPDGTNDWMKVRGVTRLYPDLQQFALHAVVWHTTGSLYIANIRIHEAREAKADEAQAQPPPTNNPYIDKSLPQRADTGAKRRGVNLDGSMDFDQDLLKELKDWHVNLIRYSLAKGKADVSSREKYLAWIDASATKLEKDLALLKPLGLQIAINLATGPGSIINEEQSNVLAESMNIDTLCAAWTLLAKRMKGNSQIYGYDLLNEPRPSDFKSPDGEFKWMEIAQRMTDAIRKIDADTPVIVQIDSISGKEAMPIRGENIIYTEHFYAPHEFTHQFVNRANIMRRIQWSYPGWINGVYYDKETLRSKMWRIIEFQRKYNAKIFIGEVGCIAWAPGAAQYLKDCLELFEEYGWDWVEFDFGNVNSGFSIISVTEALECRRPAKPGETVDRAEVIRAALSKNVEPQPRK